MPLGCLGCLLRLWMLMRAFGEPLGALGCFLFIYFIILICFWHVFIWPTNDLYMVVE